MKKLLAIVAGLMTYSAVYALPVYNPDQPELLKHGVFTCSDSCWGIELGFRGDYVFDRKLKHSGRHENLEDFHKDVCDYSISTNAGQLTLNLWDRLDVYVWVGAAQTEFEEQVRLLGTFAPTDWENIQGRTKEGTAWGVGARAVLWQCGRTALGIDGQYAYSHAKLQCLTLNDVPIQQISPFGIGPGEDPSKYNITNREWQVSLGVSHRICWFVPYVAVKYSSFRAKFRGTVFTTTTFGTLDFDSCFKNRDVVGFVAGISLVDSERMHVTAEGRFFDEKALTVAADFRF
jgi:hypothetical protein